MQAVDVGGLRRMSEVKVLLSVGTRSHDHHAAHLQQAFAQRHIPLPSELAEALAELLETRQPFLTRVWGQAFITSARALGVSGAMASQRLMCAGIERFPTIVAEPLLREAARRTRVLPLSGAATNRDVIDDAEAKITAALQPLLHDPDAMGRTFWVRTALDLHQNALESLRRKTRAAGRRDIPRRPAAEIDTPLAALVFLHPPVFPRTATDLRQQQKARRSAPHRRAGIKPREGGVVGIRHSRSLEDLPESLFSELILPRQLLAMKLLHEGILVRHRPPRREPRRDLLALNLHCAGAGDGMSTLINAAFADAAVRLQLALVQRGLLNSDLVWAGPFGQTAHLAAALDLPDLHLLKPLDLPLTVRADLLMRSGLFPDFAVVQPDRVPPEKAEDDDGTRSVLRAALAAVAPRSQRAPALSPHDYAHRFMLLSRPFFGQREPEWSNLRAEIASMAARKFGRCRHAMLVWRSQPPGSAPARTMPELIAFADGREQIRFAPVDGSTGEGARGPAEFLGELVQWIFDVTLEALDAKA